MLKRLEMIADGLTAATLKSQALLNAVAFDCENAELDGLDVPGTP